MKPTVGQKGTFVNGCGASQRCEVLKVWSDTCVNLLCADGSTPTSVLVANDMEIKPHGHFVELDAEAEPAVETMVQPKITGYRQLTEAEAALMNEGKALAAQVGQYVERLKGCDNVDGRWVAIGATQLQQGFMAVIRGIAKPVGF